MMSRLPSWLTHLCLGLTPICRSLRHLPAWTRLLARTSALETSSRSVIHDGLPCSMCTCLSPLL